MTPIKTIRDIGPNPLNKCLYKNVAIYHKNRTFTNCKGMLKHD